MILAVACSRRSDSGARAKTKASERAGKNEGRPLPQSPLVFPALSLALFFARAPLSERLEQAIRVGLSEKGRETRRNRYILCYKTLAPRGISQDFSFL